MKRLTRIILSIAILSSVLCFPNTVFAEQNFTEGSMEYKNPKNSEDGNHSFEYDNETLEPAIFKFDIEENDFLVFDGSCTIYDSNFNELKNIDSESQGYCFDKGSYFIKISEGKFIKKSPRPDRNGEYKDIIRTNYFKIDRYKLSEIFNGIFIKKDKYFIYEPYCVIGTTFGYRFEAFCGSAKPSQTKDGFYKLHYNDEYYCHIIFYYEHIKDGKIKIDTPIYCKNKNSSINYLNDSAINISKGKDPNVTETTNKDSKKPTVKGVKNKKTYKTKVKFKVSDKSGIKKVTLNGKKISVTKAKKGYTVKKKKSYTLKVWDKAGNVRVVKFKIKKK